ncbi:cardiolipin synthase [Planctomycetota bacterium]
MFSSWAIGHILLILSYSLALFGVAHMLRQRRSPGATCAWLLLFVTAPYFGAILYLMIGGRKLKRDQRERIVARFSDEETVSSASATDHETMLRRCGVPGATGKNLVTLCPTGYAGFQALTKLIDSADRTLCVGTFIFNNDETGRDILDRLVERAKAGVEVRLLVDGVGSLWTPQRVFQPLVDAGGEFAFFKPAIHVPFRSRTNLRNHRKIAVADSRLAFAGGMNISVDGLVSRPDQPCWHDLALTVEGPAAEHLESVFLSDWEFETGNRVAVGTTASTDANGNSMVQVLASGPDVEFDPMYASTLASVHSARKRVWFVTPYFVPNDALQEALVFACRRGIDVRVLVPKKSNHRLTDLASMSFLREIQSAGGTVLRYPNRMVHAKAMIVDDQFASVGSANMDMRSLFLNYEVMLVTYSAIDIQNVANWFETLAGVCLQEIEPPGFWQLIGEGMIRVASPLF